MVTYIQEYTFKVVYTSGKLNAVADALSRLENSHEAQVNVIDDPQTIEQFKPSEILQGVKEKQRADPFCNNIITYLLENKLPHDEIQACEPTTWARYMTIEDGLLFHFWTCTWDKRLSKCTKQLMIPFSSSVRFSPLCAM